MRIRLPPSFAHQIELDVEADRLGQMMIESNFLRLHPAFPCASPDYDSQGDVLECGSLAN